MSELIEIKVPSLGESVVEATVIQWLKIRDAVNIDETVAELETDKVTLEISAPETGILKEIKAKGSFVKVGEVLATISAAKQASHRPPEPTSPGNQSVLADSKAHASYAEHADQDKGNEVQLAAMESNTNTSPSARRASMAESGVEASNVHGTGKDGMITKSDVKNYINPAPTHNLPSNSPFSLKHGSYEESVENRREQRVPMSRLRSRIAERLKEAQNTAAILTTFNEADMTALQTLRAKYKDSFEAKHGIKLGFMSFLSKAMVEGIETHSTVNAEIQGNDIVYKNYYDISVAVSAPQGLVPVLRGVDQMSLSDIEKGISLLGKKARDNKLSLEDLSGSTFTISNGGVFGSLLSTPIYQSTTIWYFEHAYHSRQAHGCERTC